MKLSKLIASLPEKTIVGNPNREISGLAYDSRDVKRGFLFAAIRGTVQDGHAFIPMAVKQDASALLVEREVSNVRLPQVIVPNTREALALLADAFYQHPAQHLKLVGVTGTNGKTTTTYLCESIFREAGLKTGIIGTIQYKVGDKILECKNTTPESLDLFKLFAEMRDSGVAACAMEVSSHALDQGRIRGIPFDVVVFTNLTQDHLDYHKTMDDYFEAKAKLFTEFWGHPWDSPGTVPGVSPKLGLVTNPGDKHPVAVINGDDPYGRKLRERVKVPVLTYGLETGDVRATEVRVDWGGASFIAQTPEGKLPVRLRLTGRFNVANALAALSTGLALGFSLETIRQGLEGVSHVRGRFEQIEKGQDFAVIVDYAHTPDGLENLLAAAKHLTKGRLIVVFGCGGNRDRGKRPIMGGIAERFADVVVLTSDNPRGEEPIEIIQEIETGMKANHRVEADRKSAIETALSLAKPGDCVVIAGKGHETYQIFKDKTIHFDDREVVERFFSPQGDGGGSAKLRSENFGV